MSTIDSSQASLVQHQHHTRQEYSTSGLAWWIFIVAIVLLVLLALIFSILAWINAKPNQSHTNINRRNGHFSGDVIIDSELQVEGSAVFDDSVCVKGPTYLNTLATKNLTWISAQSITSTGYTLSANYSAYRVDLPGSNTVNITIPAASSLPLVNIIIMVSQTGQNNTVNLLLGSLADSFCSEGNPCTSSNPVYSMPINAGEPDMIELTNDGISTWFSNR